MHSVLIFAAVAAGLIYLSIQAGSGLDFISEITKDNNAGLIPMPILTLIHTPLVLSGPAAQVLTARAKGLLPQSPTAAKLLTLAECGFRVVPRISAVSSKNAASFYSESQSNQPQMERLNGN